MRDKVDIAIVGGGIVGVSAALTAASRGLEVVLIERSRLGGGATGRAAGIATLQLESPNDVKLVQRSIELINSIADKSAEKTGFLSIGNEYFFEDTINALSSAGVRYELLSSSEISDRWPDLYVEDSVVGLYTLEDLSVEPSALIEECKAKLFEKNVKIMEGVEVLDICLSSGLVRSLSLSSGDELYAESIILASGSWTYELLRRIGIELPMKIITCVAFRFDVGRRLDIPSFSDELLHSYWRPWMGSQMIGGGYDAWIADKPDISDLPPPRKYAKRAAHLLAKRVKLGSTPTLLASWRGPCSITHDLEPILGQIDGIDNLVVVEGLRGYGFMRGPALGEIAVDMISKRKTWIDVERYSPKRFISAGKAT